MVEKREAQAHGPGETEFPPRGHPPGSLGSPWACNYVRITDTQEIEAEMIEGLREHKRQVERSAVVLTNGEDEVLIIPCAAKSRYFPRGKESIRRRIRKTVSMKPVHGVAITLTEDPKRRTREQAWRTHSKDVSRTLKTLREQYRRRGLKWPSYVKVIEEQSSTGYPHTHIFVPGVKWLVHFRRLERLWGRGHTQVKHVTSSGGWYVWKYVGKVQGWSERGEAFLYGFRIRLYHVARDLRRREEKEPGEWTLEVLARAFPGEEIEVFVERLEREYRGPPEAESDARISCGRQEPAGGPGRRHTWADWSPALIAGIAEAREALDRLERGST